MSKAGIQVPVAVVGAGPVGATAANLLGCYGVETLVIDRDKDIVDYPRAIGIDDESARVLQGRRQPGVEACRHRQRASGGAAAGHLRAGTPAACQSRDRPVRQARTHAQPRPPGPPR